MDHNIFLLKHKSLNIKGEVLRWIESFLKQRNQAVRADGHLSSYDWVISGVPQGSVLEPLLFLIMVIGINQIIMTATVESFADDTRPAEVATFVLADGNNIHYNGDKFEPMRSGNTDDKPIYHTSAGTAIKQKTVSKTLVYSCPPMPNLMRTSKTLLQQDIEKLDGY